MKKLFNLFLCLSILTLLFVTTPALTASAASNPVLDKTINNIGVSKSSDGSFKINYSLLQDFTPVHNGNFNTVIVIGYSWNPYYGFADSTVEVSGKKGSGSVSLPKPKNYIDNLKFYVKYVSGNGQAYVEQKSITGVWNGPDSTISKDYHEITKGEATGYFAVYVVAPGIAAKFYPQSKVIQAVAAAASAWGLWSTFATTYNIDNGMPSPVKGQYVVTSSWYEGAKLKAKVDLYASKAAYDHKDLPIYSTKVSTLYSY